MGTWLRQEMINSVIGLDKILRVAYGSSGRFSRQDLTVRVFWIEIEGEEESKREWLPGPGPHLDAFGAAVEHTVRTGVPSNSGSLVTWLVEAWMKRKKKPILQLWLAVANAGETSLSKLSDF